MDSFKEALQDMDAFCKVIVKKMPENTAQLKKESHVKPAKYLLPMKSPADEARKMNSPSTHVSSLPFFDETLIDIFEEKDYLRVLVGCRCREQQVTFYVNKDGIRICREECLVTADGAETCVDSCQEINLRTNDLQLEDRLFVIAKCNNNQVLEAMIPKMRTNTK